MSNDQIRAFERLLDGKWIGACVLATGVSLGTCSEDSFVPELPELAWTSVADRPIECQDPSTAPKDTSGHSMMVSKRPFGREQFPSDGSRLARYTDLAGQDPASAVKAVLYDVERKLLSVRQATDWLFSRLVSSRAIDAPSYSEALRSVGSPEQVAKIACNQYRRLGNERRLAAAASVLREFGPSAWPALRWIAQSGLSDCEYFVDLVVGIPRIPSSERAEILLSFAQVGNADVRWGIVAILEDHPELRRPQIFKALYAHDDLELSEAMSHIAELPG